MCVLHGCHVVAIEFFCSSMDSEKPKMTASSAEEVPELDYEVSKDSRSTFRGSSEALATVISKHADIPNFIEYREVSEGAVNVKQLRIAPKAQNRNMNLKHKLSLLN